MSKIIYTEIYNPNGNLLFTVNELNSAKTNERCLKAKCLYCGKIFYITRKEYIAFYNREFKGIQNGSTRTFMHCSYKCMRLEKREQSTSLFETTCSCCGASIVKNTHNVRDNQQHFFCNSSCAASFSNKRRSPRSLKSRLKTSNSVYKNLAPTELYLVPRTEPKFIDNEHLPKSKFKRGWHNTWNGTRVYYRSSYELDYCYLLDSLKIEYATEAFRVRYYDTKQQKKRVAIPDFYIPSTNTVVEVKSAYTYDQQNMIDRSTVYKRHGYNFKLILEHAEFDFCPPNLLNRTIYDDFQ